MRKNRKLLWHLLFTAVILMTAFFIVPASAAPPATTKFTTGLASDTGYYLEVYNGSWQSLNTPKHWGTESSTVALCLDHTKEAPTGTQNYVRFSASSVYSQRTINGLYAILENGYPFNTTHSMTGNEIKTATQNAIRIWMRESEGIGYSYMKISNIRAKGGYSHVYNMMVNLVNSARNASGNLLSWAGKSITTTPSVIELTPNAEGTALTATFTVNNPASSLAIDTSKLPSGISISGSGNTRTITAPLGTPDMTISNMLLGQSNSTLGTIYFYKTSYGSTCQPLIAWDYTDQQTVVYGSLSIKGQQGGYIQVVKNGERNSEKLQGAVFGLFDDSDNSRIAALTTDADGRATSSFLVAGDYYVIEETPPTGYLLDDTRHDVTVTATNETQVITLSNTQIRGNLKIIKTGEKDDPLQGVVFAIYDVDDNLIEELITDENGETISSDLVYGDYYLKEKTTLPQYNLLTGPIPFEIRIDDAPVTIDIENTLIRGNIQIIKTGESVGLLEGVIFELYDSEGNLIETLETNEDGETVSADLIYGDYFLKEVSAPVVFSIPEESEKIEIRENGKTLQLEIENTLIRGSVHVVKTNMQNDEPIAGVVFWLLSSDGEKLEGLITDEKGEASSSTLYCGKYYLWERSVPDEFILDDKLHEFEISKDGVVEINIKNQPIVGSVEVYYRHIMHGHELYSAFSYTDWVGEEYMPWLISHNLDEMPILGYRFVKADYPSEQELIDGKLTVTFWYEEQLSGQWENISIPKTGQSIPWHSYITSFICFIASGFIVAKFRRCEV